VIEYIAQSRIAQQRGDNGVTIITQFADAARDIDAARPPFIDMANAGGIVIGTRQLIVPADLAGNRIYQSLVGGGVQGHERNTFIGETL